MKLRRSSLLTCGWLGAGLAGLACGRTAEIAEVVDKPPAGLDWSSGKPSFVTDPLGVEPYTGDDPVTLEAQAAFRTGAELHSKVVLRSCGPTNGVCHNQKEYPDIHTSFNFLATIGAPCNVQSGTIEGVFDRCERYGDRFALGDSPEIEIGWLELIPKPNQDDEYEVGPDMPGLHLHLADPISTDFNDTDDSARFIRTFIQNGNVEDLSYSLISTRWYVFDDGRHVVGEVRYSSQNDIAALMQVGVEQGDLNRNGTFGARPDENGNVTGPVSLIERGSPETSYLVARLRGQMNGTPVPGTRMPLANAPFSVPEMLAMFCFIEGLPAEGEINLASGIDYKNCSYNVADAQGGLSVSGGAGQHGWLERIKPLLEANCGGCHSPERAEGDLVLVGDDVEGNIVNVVAPGDPLGRPYIEPGNPEGSYLILKLENDPTIEGKPMPLDPLDGVRSLSEQELTDIRLWVTCLDAAADPTLCGTGN
ncbi:MAG TPA: hypothetical protein VLC09_09965 [Polyangiaceae bacterium]|nr:hypothetical protein [Polyangiaceae bacterium]